MPNTAPDMLRVGGVVGGRYEVQSRVGANRIGQRFLGRDVRTGTDVEVRAARAYAASLREEAQRMISHRHPALPEVLSLGMQGEVQFVVMARVHGTPLATHLARRAPAGLSLDEIVAIAIEIADALAVVHRAAIAHDVIAPDNLVFGPHERVALAEVGLIRAERELAADSPYASRCPTARQRDCFALGVIAFEALTGSVPAPWEPIATQLARLPEGYASLAAPIVALIDVRDGREPPSLEATIEAFRAARVALRPQSIVIADPDRGVRTLLAQVLRWTWPGATLRFCGDGRALLDLLAVQPADTVFFDPELPRTDVGELIRALRSHPGHAPRTICATRNAQAVGRRLGIDLTYIEITPRTSKVELAERIRGLTPHVRSPPRPRTKPMSAPPRLPARPAPTAPPAAVAMAPGVTLSGRYTVEERLGEGGMGNVFAVRHIELGKRFALKVLHPTLAAKPASRERFLEEAKLASQLSHPNIVSVVDFGHDPDHGVFLVMELLSGVTLARYAGRLSIRRTCETIGQLVDALDMLHRNGIVHGDIKADNVMMVEESLGSRRRSVARLIDFGLAHRMSTIDARGPLSGTPEYMAPERTLGEPPSIATDIYAAGVVAYELLAGNVPFQGRVDDVLEAQRTTPPPPIVPQRGDAVDPAIEGLVMRAMHKDPTKRHATASALRYELNNVMRMLGITRARSTRRPQALEGLFESSRLAQAVVRLDGTLELANDAFRALASDPRTLRFDEMTLGDAVAHARNLGAPVTRRVHGGDTAMVAMIAPLAARTHIVFGPAPRA